jgi:ABC-type multidrug transport system permease subunit
MYPITYVVIQSLPGSGFSSTITQDDYTTLLKYNITRIPGSFSPVDTLSANIKQLNGLILSSVQASASEKSSTISTSAVKCYPVDPSKNIKNNQLYLNLDGSPKNTLADELAPPNDTTESAPSFWTSASGIETIVGIIVASFICLIVATILIRRNYNTIGTTASTFIAKTTAKSVAKTATSAVTSTSISAIGSILSSISSNSTIIFASLFVMMLILFVVFLILYLTK